MDEYVTSGEAGALLGVSPRRVRQLADAGLLTAIPLGRFLVYCRQQVEQLAKKERPRGWPKGKPRKPKEE